MDINTTKKVIRAAMLAQDTVIIEGPHGVGKSDAAKQVTKEDDIHLETLFLSNNEVGDIVGIPHMNSDNVTVWSEPIWLQRANDAAFPTMSLFRDLTFSDNEFKQYVMDYVGDTHEVSKSQLSMLFRRFYKVTSTEVSGEILTSNQTKVSNIKSKQVLLFLDELNRAPLDVRQSAMQLVLERQIHEHKLPMVCGEPTMIVAAINPADDYQVDELDPALLDRFLHVTVECDAKSWLEWGRLNKVNNVVRDFIAAHPDRLHWTPEDGGIGATPRSWTKLGSYMDKIEFIPDEVIFQVFKGKVGVELGSQFFSFYKNYVDVITADDIINVVKDHKDDTSDIEQLGDIIREVIITQEAIQKSELADQLNDIAKDTNDLLPLLAFLYATEVEICVSFLKKMKTDMKRYSELAKLDGELNNKQLFVRIVTAAYKTDK